MVSEKDVKDVNFVTEKITRRYEIELPLEFEDFNLENGNLYITFQKSEISRTFELTKGVTLEFDNNSRIIGLKVDNMIDYLPKETTTEMSDS